MTWYKRFGVLTVIALWLISGILIVPNHGGVSGPSEHGSITSLDVAKLLTAPPLIQPSQQAGIPALRPGTLAAEALPVAITASSPEWFSRSSTTFSADSPTFLLARTWRFLERAAAFPRSPTDA